MYNFAEKQLGHDFAREKLEDFRKLIDASTSFVAMSMPGVGASYFLKYLACHGFAHFIHVDLYSLPSLTLHEFYKLLLEEILLTSKESKPTFEVLPASDADLFRETKNILRVLAEKNSKTVIIFSRFDQLTKEFDANFLSNLQSLTTTVPGKIVLIFTSIKPLSEISPDAVTGGNLTFYSKYLYFKPYSEEDLKKLLKIDPEPIPSSSDLNELIKLSGGHFQLLKILLNSQKEQLILDQFVKLQMKGLIDYLDYTQRKQIQKVALRQAQGKPISEIDDYLLGVGMINDNRLFSPLLAEYVRQNISVKLPPKEAKLFRLLRNSMGKIVDKEEIFNALWPDGEGSNWALDALVYRLRKHPFIQNQGYIIESHKKVGYTLTAV